MTSVSFLKEQHNLIADMFDDVLSASSDEAREKAFVDLRQLLAVHETAEEMVVHPRARGELSDGDEIVDARLKEEHDAKEQLQQLEKMDIGSKEFLNELNSSNRPSSITLVTRKPRNSASCSGNSTPTTSNGWRVLYAPQKLFRPRGRIRASSRRKRTSWPDHSHPCLTALRTPSRPSTAVGRQTAEARRVLADPAVSTGRALDGPP